MPTERLHLHLPLETHNHRLSWHEEPELNLSWPESYWIKLIFERLSFTEQGKCQRREALCSWQMTREAVSVSECAHEALQTVNCNYCDFEVAHFCRIKFICMAFQIKMDNQHSSLLWFYSAFRSQTGYKQTDLIKTWAGATKQWFPASSCSPLAGSAVTWRYL